MTTRGAPRASDPCVRCSDIDRLFARAELVAATGCWRWTGPAGGGRNGRYGRCWFRGKTTKPHIAMYKLLKGAIPRNKVVMHTCDDPLCFNPAHLVAGTQSQNMKDCARRGRHPTLFKAKGRPLEAAPPKVVGGGLKRSRHSGVINSIDATNRS